MCFSGHRGAAEGGGFLQNLRFVRYLNSDVVVQSGSRIPGGNVIHLNALPKAELPRRFFTGGAGDFHLKNFREEANRFLKVICADCQIPALP